jgi:uncharacterized protein (TIGR03435 family)
MLRVSVAVLLPILSPILVLAQAPAGHLRFETCDIQVSKTPSQAVNASFLPGGRVDVRNMSLKLMIAAVYKTPDGTISGPAWLSSARYDIVAKAPPTSTQDQLFEMMKTMLAERFKMRYHMQQKSVLAYVLIAPKKSPNLSPSTGAKKTSCDPAPAHAGGDDPAGMNHRVCHGLTMADLARQLAVLAPEYIEGLPVVDQTGVKGAYDFKLDWVSRRAYAAAVGANNGAPPSDERVLSIFDAVEKLGLRLENRNQSLDVIVIDSIERNPTAN